MDPLESLNVIYEATRQLQAPAQVHEHLRKAYMVVAQVLQPSQQPQEAADIEKQP